MTQNFAAFLAVIRACEGTSGPNGYRTLFGGGLFDSYADHPRQTVRASGYTSTAAGAYQILSSTWDDFVKANGPHDFSPDSQDLCARWLIARRGATADVEAGWLRAAIAKCGKEWASLPGSPYGQPTRTLAYCEQIFHLNGGNQTDADQAQPVTPTNPPNIPAQPQPQESQPMGAIALPLLAQLIPQVLGLFSTRAQAQLTKVTGDPAASATFMQGLISQVGQVVGVPVTDDTTAVLAVGKLTASPQPDQVQQLENHALDYLDKVGPMLDKLASIDKAKWDAELAGRQVSSGIAIAEKQAGIWDMTKTLVAFAGATSTLLVLALGAAIIWQAITGSGEINSGLLGIAGPILAIAMGVWREVFAYRFDGTKESSQQTQAILNMSQPEKP